MSENLAPHGAMPNGAMPNGAMPNGAMPNGAMPNGAMPNGAMPESATPNSAMSPIQKPEFNLGGQALVEGVMMRSPRYIGAAVRRADGSIETRVEPFQSISAKHRWMRLPFLRGVVGLIEMMTIGMRFLNWSAQKAMEDDKSGQAESKAEGAALANGFIEIGASLGDAPAAETAVETVDESRPKNA